MSGEAQGDTIIQVGKFKGGQNSFLKTLSDYYSSVGSLMSNTV